MHVLNGITVMLPFPKEHIFPQSLSLLKMLRKPLSREKPCKSSRKCGRLFFQKQDKAPQKVAYCSQKSCAFSRDFSPRSQVHFFLDESQARDASPFPPGREKRSRSCQHLRFIATLLRANALPGIIDISLRSVLFWSSFFWPDCWATWRPQCQCKLRLVGKGLRCLLRQSRI